MSVIKIAVLALASCWLALGAAALGGLAGLLSDSEPVGRALITPAMVLGIPRVPAGPLYYVEDGWPVLNLAGVLLVYIAPVLALFLLRHWITNRKRSIV